MAPTMIRMPVRTTEPLFVSRPNINASTLAVYTPALLMSDLPSSMTKQRKVLPLSEPFRRALNTVYLTFRQSSFILRSLSKWVWSFKRFHEPPLSLTSHTHSASFLASPFTPTVALHVNVSMSPTLNSSVSGLATSCTSLESDLTASEPYATHSTEVPATIAML